MPQIRLLTGSVACPIFRIKGHAPPNGGFFRRVYLKASKAFWPGKGPKRKRRTKVYHSNAEFHLTQEQVKKLIESCSSTRDRLIVQVLAYSGIRRAEITGLDISDIRWTDFLILIRHGKGNKQRLVPLPPFVFEELGLFLGGRTHGPVFKSQKGGNISCRQLNRIIADIGHKAKLTNPNPKRRNITCHLLRHTFARFWKQNRGSMESLSYILGHASQATTMDLYGKESVSEMQKNYNDIFNRSIG